MRTIAFLFPGQGAQYPGMGKDFYEEYKVCKEVIDEASRVCQLDIPRICFTENEELNVTEFTQIAMISVEAAILALLEQEGISPSMSGGLSLGEYGALLASGVMKRKDIFSLIRKRGIYMQNAVPSGGAMSAVLGLEPSVIEQICKEVTGIVSVANYNCPEQTVITGESCAVEEAGVRLKEQGAKRVIPLKVSGPFHSTMLKRASEQLREALEEVEVLPFTIPYLSNVTGGFVRPEDQVKALLAQQLCAPVRWQQGVEAMIKAGVDTFIEIGPGKTLSGFLRKIDPKVTSYSIQTVKDFKEVCDAIK